MDPLQETFSEQLKEMCRDRFGGIPGFARKHDLRPQTVYSELRKEPVTLSAQVLMALAKEFELDPYALEKGAIVSQVAPPVSMPFYGSVAAGQPLEMLPVMERYPAPAILAERYPRAFFLRVNGESMNKVLPNGVYALINPCVEVAEAGEPYVVVVGEDEATIKRVRVLNNGVELIPESTDPTFKTQLFDYSVSGTKPIRIIGQVGWYTVPINWRF